MVATAMSLECFTARPHAEGAGLLSAMSGAQTSGFRNDLHTPGRRPLRPVSSSLSPSGAAPDICAPSGQCRGAARGSRARLRDAEDVDPADGGLDQRLNHRAGEEGRVPHDEVAADDGGDGVDGDEGGVV